jgi:tetratricopeptide (TPR) repeat protein
MNVERIIAGLRAADESLTPVELAETMWLAGYLPKRRAASVGDTATPYDESSPPATGPGPATSPTEPPSRPAPAGLAGTPSRRPAGRAGPASAARLYLPTDGDPAGGLATRSPAVPALPGALALYRALRPLRRYAESSTRTWLDEERTAEASAAGGRWIPRVRPERARWLELALVVDDSPSMAVWRRTIRELRSLFERLGAFRDIRTWSIDTGGDGTAAPLLRGGAGPAAGSFPAVHDPRELLSPDGRRLVLMVSDCVGPAWRGGALLDWLEQWGRSGPTAILQTLPQRLWDRCALDITRVRMAADRPVLPNHRLDVTPRDPEVPIQGVAVPVLEIEPRWLAPWARLVAGAASGGVWGAAFFTGWTPRERLFGVRSTPGRDGDDAAGIVLRFRAAASPEAYELARFLSAAPLNLPVMRLVQSAMLPRSRPRHLAEVFLSELMCRLTPPVARQDPETVLYDFRPGVRDLLASTLAPDTSLRLLVQVSDFISQRLGATLDFPALLAGAEPPARVDEVSRPFAAVASTVLRALGGRYRSLADKLATAMAGQASSPLPSPVGRFRGTQPLSHRFPVNPRTPISGGTVSASTPFPSPGTDQQPATLPAVWGGVPPRNPNFTGRTELLTGLREHLTSKATALLPHTLHGLGGVGKTQLAVEYVYRYTSEYDLVWWVPSEQPPLIRQSLLALAPQLRLKVGPGDDVQQTLNAINDALRLGTPYRRWLLVFDNADRPEELGPFLSNPSGHILITSRNRSWENSAATVEVDVFERTESIELLTRRLPKITQAEADELAERLGDLPLALEQAASWQSATAMPTSEYLALLEEHVGALLSESQPSDYPRPVAAAWGLAFDQLTEKAPAALQMLELCAFLGSEPISVRLLREGRHIDLPTPLRDAVRDDIPMRRAIRDVVRYGLAKVDPANNSLQIHRLVQAVLRDRIPMEERARFRSTVHALLAAANPSDPEDEKTWPRHAELSPHIRPGGLVEGESPDNRRVVLDQIRYQYLLGDFESSRELAELAVEKWRQRLGPDDEQTLVAGRYLGIALRALGRVREARELNEDVYARTRSTFGADHEHTLATANSMGADLRLRGEWPRARDLDTEMLALHRQVFGEDDPSTLLSANNLAVDYRLLGDFAAARDIDIDTENRQRRVLGDEHPYTLRIISNLSRDYYGLGDYRRAMDLQRQSLPIHRRVLGEDHYEVLRATRIHVVTLRKLGDIGEAADLAEQLVATSRRRLGDNHPDTMVAAMTLSNCRAAIERPREARIAGEDALARLRELLGGRHPFTLAAMTNLATILRGMGDYTAARALDERALNGFREAFAPDHTYVLCAGMNLANDMAAAHDHVGARELSDRSRQGMVEQFGPTHPQTLVCTFNYVLDLGATGDPTAAARLREEVLAQLRDTLGVGHPATVSAEAGQRASIEIEPPNP